MDSKHAELRTVAEASKEARSSSGKRTSSREVPETSSAGPSHPTPRVGEAIPGLAESGASSNGPSHVGLRMGTARPRCRRSDTSKEDPKRPLPPADSGGP